MKKILYALCALMLIVCACSGPETDYSANLFVGTGGFGHTYPGASAPFGMVQLSPDTRCSSWEGTAGYYYTDTTITGFSHTHLSGTGGGEFGDFLFVPVIGDVSLTEKGYQAEPMPFSHKDETASPGYYKVELPSSGITAELTATERAGSHRYTFCGEGERHILIDMRYNIGDTRPDSISFASPSSTCIQGGRCTNGWSRNRWMFFSAVFSEEFTSCTPDGKDRYLLTFPAETEELTVSIGLSTVDAEAAEKNRMAEAPECDFDAVRAASKALWDAQMSKIVLEGGSRQQRDIFYTALYHTLIVPNLLTDVDGRFRNHKQEVDQAPEGRGFYSTFSLWDTFRTWNPLQTIMNVELVKDMVFSMMNMYDCDGQLPQWSMGGSDTDCMIAYHSISVIADAWLRGIRSFDGDKALEAMVKSSDMDPASGWYNQYDYIPCDLTPQSISITLEMCYDDWCIARMAESLGRMDVAERYYARAQRFRNILDPASGFFRGKNSEGNWRTPFDPTGRSRDYTEATAWQYRHFVPHDMAAYTDLMGGPEAVLASLDSLFEYDYVNPTYDDGNVTGIIGQYAQGNEPSHASAWLYAYVGEPSSTQKWVRTILDTMYTLEPDGLCGNEDCGQMSAWYVMAAMGLYPVCPGTGEYIFAAPLFNKISLDLPGGKSMVITADKPQYPYIKDVLLNGVSVDAQYLTYEQLMQGGTLEFKLSKTPCHDRDALKAPYSFSEKPLVSTPYLTANPCFFDTKFDVVLLSRTPDAEIRYTLDGSEPTEASALYESPFTIDNECVISARAFKQGCEPSPIMSLRAFPIEYLESVQPGELQQGCKYSYRRGAFLTVAEMEASPVVSSGTMPSPAIEDAPDEDHFGYVFEGYLDVPDAGLWEISTRSDDGSVLMLDGRLVVNNDGSHGNYKATGHVALRKGLHAFKLLYFEDYDGQHLDWSWKAPGTEEFVPIPDAAVFYK